MTIELIPVIEIGYNNQGVPTPDKFPWWDNSGIWDKYNADSYSLAGFKDKLTPYLQGSSLYKLTDITNDNLIKLTTDQTEELRNGKYERGQVAGFSGGYILRVDNQDKYFPQCCGELSDIIYWDKLANGQESYYEGHPAPQVEFKADLIVFDFTEDVEPFQPPPADIILKIERTALKKAVDKVKVDLEQFSQRLNKINADEKLNITDIDKLLVWDNANYV